MDLLTGSIKIEQPEEGDSVADVINMRLHALVMNTEGTLPGNRAFGMPTAYLSQPVNLAINTFAAELQERVDKWMPEISIDGIAGATENDGDSTYALAISQKEEITI